MKQDTIFVGNLVEEDGVKRVHLDFHVYLHLFVETMESAGVREDLVEALIYEYQEGLKKKKKRIRHKRIKQVADLMYGLIIAVNELEREDLIALNIVEQA